jgi:beta-glucanase (GH16 family)
MLGSTSKLMIAMIAVGVVACSGGSSNNGGSGGAPGAGGEQGTGGLQGAGGARGDGGVPGSGGKPGSGGAQGTGGALGSGGRVGTGGMPGTGGLPGSGGAVGSGGAIGTGTGGQGKGGAPVDAGVRGTGGVSGTGGAAGGTPGAKCPDGWTLAWSDEFEGAAGSAVDSSKWAYDSGPNWYNNELQYYSQGSDNAKLDGSGNLVIEARKESREGRQYTSARIKTEGKKTFTYGRFEGRMKLPYGQGMWPAFWLLGAQGGSWPACGEIDIMENLGKEPSISHGSMHGPGYSGASGPTATYTLPDAAKFSDDFHVFAIEWEQSAIRWYVDGKLFSTKTQSDIGSGNSWVFNHPFFFILNLAVGGDWPGAPDGTTVFPQKMIVDYVRVCQH